MEEHWYRLKKIAGLTSGKTLDIGFALCPNPFLKGEIVGADLILPRKKPANYSKMIKADVCKLPFPDGSFDTVIMSGLIEHLENPLKALKEVQRVLKTKGLLLVETPNVYFPPLVFFDWFMSLRYYFTDTHLNLFPRRIMLKLFWKSGFDLKKIIGCGFNLTTKITIPLPQQLSQDVIYIAVKKKPENRFFNDVMNRGKVVERFIKR